MEIKKGAEAVSSGIPTAAQLEAINAQAKAQLTAYAEKMMPMFLGGLRPEK